MVFRIDDQLLRDLFALSSFPVPQAEMAFFALRGTRPVEGGGTGFAAGHALEPVRPDHRHMRCTIGQWLPDERQIAVFVGSSLPNIDAVRDGLTTGGEGVNQLCSGWYGAVPGGSDTRYVKGHHGADRHLAFRNENRLPVRRTVDDAIYDGDDRLEVHRVVYDNLHCARQQDEAAAWYSSNGCIVVAGRPGPSHAAEVTTEAGAWRRFLLNAYGRAQTRFALAVFEPGEAQRLAAAGLAGRVPTVRFGAQGPLVTVLQAGLAARGYDPGGPPDGIFGPQTLLALHRFQRDTFGAAGTDLIAGGGVARALGLDWPASGADVPGPQLTTAEVQVIRPATMPAEDPDLRHQRNATHCPLPGWRILADGATGRGAR